MRKRFLSAVKGENPEWNQLFDYIFDFYLYRMGKLPENREDSPIKSKTWYKVIRNMFRDGLLYTRDPSKWWEDPTES